MAGQMNLSQEMAAFLLWNVLTTQVKKPGIDIFHSIQTVNSSHTTDLLQKGSAQNKK